MRRRTFFVQVGLGIAGLAACNEHHEQNADNGDTAKKTLFKSNIEAVVDTFVPRDQDPGAVEAGVADELVSMMKNDRTTAQHVTALVDRVEIVAQHKFSKPFHALGSKRREIIIKRTMHSRRDDDKAASKAIVILGGWVIESFYLTQAGQEMLGYHAPFPLGYPNYSQAPISS